MIRTLLLTVGLAACATGAPLDQPSAPSYEGQLHLLDSSADLPTRRVRLALPTAREMVHSARRLVSRVDLCVTPTGDTQNVNLRVSSGDRLFDEAVVADVTRLQYRPRTGASVTCEQATITYTP
jgi:TonB family protein